MPNFTTITDSPENVTTGSSIAPERRFQVAINPLWPGQKLKSKDEGETLWSRHTGAWRTETHTLESFCQRITGDGFSFCAVLKRPWRIGANFQSLQVLATDHDGAPLETLLEDPLIEDHAAFIYETPSSTLENPKSRAAYVLDTPITDAGMARLAYRALIWHFSNGAPDAEADRACKDPTRFFYGRPQAPHQFLGNILYRDVLQEIIEDYLTSGTSADLDYLDLFEEVAERYVKNGASASAPARTGDYDPHRGPRLADVDQLALAKFLTGKGMKLCHDGRFNGPCLFHDCDCPGAAYISRWTGSWYCFCSDHPGVNHGSVEALADVGFTPPQRPRTVPPHRQSAKTAPTGSPGAECPLNSEENPFLKKRRANYRQSALWDWCCDMFPMPIGKKPPLISNVALSRDSARAHVFDSYASTWFNEANAAHKCRVLLYNLFLFFTKTETYMMTVAAEDWSEKRDDAIQKRVERKGGKVFGIDNSASRRCWVYLSTVQATGFELVDDISGALLEAVKGITVPKDKPLTAEGQVGKFRPTRGSRGIMNAAENAPDDDKGKMVIIARKAGGTDFPAWEAELRALGRRYDYIDPIYLSQVGQGLDTEVDRVDPFAEAIAIAEYLGYEDTKHRAKAKQQGVAA
jgi:hypothetical protein